MVTPSYEPIVGGVEGAVKKLYNKLNASGINADILTLNMNRKWFPFPQDDIIRSNGAKIIRAAALRAPSLNIRGREVEPFALAFNIHAIPRFNFAALFREYHVIHFFDDIDLSLPAFSIRAKGAKLFHLRTLDYTFDFYLTNPLARYLLGHVADTYICGGKRSATRLTRLGISKERIRLLYHGVDVEKFTPGSCKLEHSILFVGRIQRPKGLHVLLESLTRINEPLTIVIVGPISDGKYYEEIWARAREQDLERKHKLLWLGPITDQSCLIDWYRKSSVHVCPSLREEVGNSILEAMACGTPVVATNVGNIPELVRDRRTGILVPPDNASDLARAIEYVVENEDVRKRFACEARIHVSQNFSLDKTVSHLVQIYEEASERKPAGQSR